MFDAFSLGKIENISPDVELVLRQLGHVETVEVSRRATTPRGSLLAGDLVFFNETLSRVDLFVKTTTAHNGCRFWSIIAPYAPVDGAPRKWLPQTTGTTIVDCNLLSSAGIHCVVDGLVVV